MGDVLYCEAGVKMVVRVRVAAACKNGKSWGSLFVNKNIPLDVRDSVYEACFRPVILNGFKTWAMSGRMDDSCDRWMLRYMTGKRKQGRLSSEEVARCGLMEINWRIRGRRLQGLGHVRRMLKIVDDLEVLGKKPVEDWENHWGQCSRTWRCWKFGKSPEPSKREENHCKFNPESRIKALQTKKILRSLVASWGRAKLLRRKVRS